jgi:hypothetical protein
MINKEIEKINKRLENEDIEIKEKNKLENRKKKLKDRKKELIKRKKNENDKNKRENMRINITSPDTVKMIKRNKKWIQDVNLQAVINQDNIVNVYEATRKCNDNGLLGIMYDKLCNFLKIIIVNIYLLVDCGYWNIEDITRLDPAKGYKIIMPSVGEVIKSRNKKGTRGSSVYSLEDFKYDKEKDVYICKNGKQLKFRGMSNYKKRQVKYTRKVYNANKKMCDGCKYFKKCVGAVKHGYKILTKNIAINESDVIERFKDYYEENSELYKKRGIINEPTHAHMFHNNNITRLHCINGPQIDGEIALIILIDTLKKVWRRHNDAYEIIFLFFLLRIYILYNNIFFFHKFRS